MNQGHLYFHAPCFDGIVSAVLAADFLEQIEGWRHTRLHTVNYHLRSGWLTMQLHEPFAVVDFLYHPDAFLWADHHATSFLTDTARAQHALNTNNRHVYDDTADSCAGLLQGYFEATFSYRNDKHDELVRWACKTDAARYESVDEAIFPDAPALVINIALAFEPDDELCVSLVQGLRDQDLSTVASWPQVQSRYRKVRLQLESGLDRFKQSASMTGGIVRFDVDGRQDVISRYAPYHYFPRARYSAGVVHGQTSSKITVMRNPWIDFSSPHLGRICERFGGGGHRRIGGIMLPAERAGAARSILDDVIAEIRKQDARIAGHPSDADAQLVTSAPQPARTSTKAPEQSTRANAPSKARR